jgi:hypothetical protein
MSAYIHKPMNSPKTGRKGCQMKIRYRKCKNCASRLPFSRRLCSPLSARDSAGSHSALVQNPSHDAKPCRVNLEAGRKQPCSTYKPGQNSNEETVTSNCFGTGKATKEVPGKTWICLAPFGYELPAGRRSEPLLSKLSALSTDI